LLSGGKILLKYLRSYILSISAPVFKRKIREEHNQVRMRKSDMGSYPSQESTYLSLDEILNLPSES